MYDFASQFNQLHLSDTEIGLFSGVILASSGESNEVVENVTEFLFTFKIKSLTV
jgi:hypothetical protein